MRSNESSEDYLETILILGNRSSLVRAVDIAAEMGFKKPSVSVAMKNLRQKKSHHSSRQRRYPSDRGRT